MKKLRVFIMSIFVLALGTFLVACDLKKPEATFDKKEIVVSVNASISLDEYLSVKGVEKKNITFKLERPELFDFDGRTLIVGNKSGKSYVHALYKKNILSSMQIVIKDKFNAPVIPENHLSSEGVFSWNAVSALYGNEVVSASQYRVQGTCDVYSATDPSLVTETIQINETVSKTNFKLTRNGVYHLTVTALGSGYFDRSEPSEEVTLSFGYMTPAENFVWDGEKGTLTWDAVQNAEYVIKFDGVELATRQTEACAQLFDRLTLASAGDHTVSVVTYDTQEKLLAVESETLIIHKLDLPDAEYVYDGQNGGRIKIATAENVYGYAVEFSSGSLTKTTMLINEGNDIVSSFDDLEAGLYDVRVTAVATKDGEMYFNSSVYALGKVYKLPTASITGAGANEVNGTSFGVNLSSEANPVDVMLLVDGLGNKTLVEGFEKGQTNFNFELTLPDAGIYSIVLRQIPVAGENVIANENVFVLNSNESEPLSATKIDLIEGEVTHAYVDEKSVLTFAKSKLAQSYGLQINEGSGYVDVLKDKYNDPIVEGEVVKIVLNGKMEDLFETIENGGKDVFDLRVVCKGAEQTNSINSVVTKTIERLKTPQTAHSGNSDKKSYAWVGSSGADSYEVELFKIDKTVYDANKDASQISIDTTGLTNLGKQTAGLKIDIAEVGYYFVRVKALSGDENQKISSEGYLEEVFYVCEKLEISNVDLAQNESGYYISISNNENVSSFEVFLDGVSLGTSEIAVGEKTDILISDKFENSGKEYQISVVAHAENEQIYNESLAYSLLVERLPRVVRGDITIGELTLQANADMSVKSTSQQLSINAIEGANGVKIWDGAGTSAGSETEKSARLSIANSSNFEYNFKYFGSQQQNGVFAKASNKVYLDGETTAYTFTRLQQPTNLAYYAGKLRFDHSATLSKDYYVLTLVCAGLNGKTENITVKLGRTVTAEHGGVSQNIGSDADFVAINGNVVSIDFEKIIEEIQKISALANVYNQSAKVGFAVYAFQDRTENTAVTICSDFATTNLDNTKIVCVVEKMPKSTLSLDIETSSTDYILNWTAVGANAAYESETKYQVMINGEEAGESMSALTKSFARSEFEDSTYYEFSVVVSNPYYVQSDISNVVRIYKLGSISMLKLFEDGRLGYDLSSGQKDFVDYVKVVSANSVDNNRTGKIEIDGDGTLTLKVVGKKGVEGEGEKTTYYIDSEEKSWNLASMSLIKPADESVKYENNTISWQPFASSQNLSCLRYVLMFVDENSNTATFKTTNTSENLTTNRALYNALSSLSGEVKIYVSAYLETFPESGVAEGSTYTVSAGNTIYYSKDVTLPIGGTGCNYYVYSGNATVQKFETPNITDVRFISNDLANALLPTISVDFVGNYGTSRNFDIFLNGEYYTTKTIAQDDGKYSFELLPEDYNSRVSNGETLTVGVCALSETDILSSIGSVDVVRTEEVSSICFVETAEGELSHTIEIGIPTVGTSGGVVVKMTYQENEGEEKEEYILVPVGEVLSSVKFDLSTLLSKVVDGKKILAKGGRVILSAHLASSSLSGEYFLACPTWTNSEEYQILASVEEVEKTSGGFTIDASINSENTTYILECNNSIFEVVFKNEQFYFEFPHGGSWANGTYDISIYAKQEGFLPSIVGNVEFVLNKLDSITDIKILRDQGDLSAITLSWNQVAGATGYVFRMYDANDETRTNLLYEYIEDRVDSSEVSNSASLLDIFGEGYQKLLDYGKVDAFALMSDKNVFFDVFVRGTQGVNDSDIYSFDAVIKGNALEISNFEVNQYGYIVLQCVPEQTYLYRFVASDGAVLQKWTKLVATSEFEKIDTKQITALGGTYFNMEVVVVGNNLAEEVSTKLEGLVVDSIAFSTSGTGTTFVVGEDIVRVGYIESEGNIDLSFELVAASYSKIYVGLDENALINGQVAEFIPNFVAVGGENGQEICSFSLSIIVDRLKEKGFDLKANNQDVDLYFWAYRIADPSDRENTYTISHASSCKFTYTNQIDFVEVKKLGEDLADTSRYMEDYANSFAIFENNDESENKTTFGIYVKISPIQQNMEDEEEVATEEDLSQTIFVDKKTLTSGDYFHDANNFVLNLTKVFEQSNFAELFGKFKFEFATLSVKSVDGEMQFVLSDWISGANGKEFVFKKLQNIDRLELNSGSLTWLNIEEAAQKYYVYFVDRLGSDGGLGESYVYTAVTTSKYVASYNASEFVGLGQGYYLAVRSVSEDPYTLPSLVKFVSSQDGTPTRVEKNEIKSSVKVENGKIFIPFVEGNDDALKYGGTGQDFVDYIKTCSESTDAIDKLLTTTFKVPFTFTLDQLVSGEIFFRFRFTSLKTGVQGKSQTFDVDARNLISSLIDIDDGFDYIDKLQRLEKHASSGGSTISSFIKLMQDKKDGVCGIGTYQYLFDDRFESLQSGEYKLEYALLGNRKSLTSGWYSYSGNGQNSLYVNNEPSVKAIREEAVGGYNSANAYKLMVKKSDIFSKNGSELSGSIAENYIMKIYNEVGKYYAFSISKVGSKYSLMLIGDSQGASVTVKETNQHAVETENGEYLLLYINMNEGDSILGRYGEQIEKGTYKMQIFAVGNEYSLSSKSSVFNLTLYGFGTDFTLNNGEFTWTALRNMKTTVVYKKNSSVGETVSPEPIVSNSNTARYSLDETGYGLYDYVDFLVVGDVYGNNILVDSEVYRVRNVYKLQDPTLKNTNGYIEIDDTANANLEGLDGCYSDLSLYNYKIYNNVSTSAEFMKFVDDNNAQSSIMYEVGTTGMSQTSADYSYKFTETNAGVFYVASIGTSATFDIQKSEEAATYYMKDIQFVNKTGVDFEDPSAVGIAVRSNFASLEAKMIDRVGGAKITNGVLTWNSVTGREDDDLALSPNEKVVYKVSVVQYDLSYSEDDQVENPYPNLLEFYTLETEFDFARIEEERLNKSAKYMKATIQALAMNTSQSVPAFPTYLQLLEGGYAYGNVKYLGSESYVLMGDGDTIRLIERSQSIDEGSLQVVEGGLVWTVTFDVPTSASDGFADKYIFSVVDEDFNEIEGEYRFEQGLTENQVKVFFAERKGEMKEKTQILTVYMTKIGVENVTVKSFGKEIEVTKLKTIYANDYTITSNEENPNIEVLDFSTYFVDNQANELELLIYQNLDKSDVPIKISFNSRRNKLYILAEDIPSITGNETGFAGKFVVGQNSKLILNFIVKNTSLANCLYSDVSDDIILQRSSWGNGQINWDSNAQRFEWTYGGQNALGETVKAKQIEFVDVTNKVTLLFFDEMKVPVEDDGVQRTIPEGEEIVVLRVFDTYSNISYQGRNDYYISNEDYQNMTKVVGEETLVAGTLFRPVQILDETQTVIMTDDGRKFAISSNLVVSPVYLVEATYGEGTSQIVRTYTTTNSYFVPTIVGKVTISIKIKLGESNIQSQALEFTNGTDEVQMVDFNLFAGGQGTSQNPYLISNETQFKNIANRLSKDKDLTKYTENGKIKAEEEKYYFSIQNDIKLSSALKGILFEGVFTGEIRGNGHVVEYENSGVSKLTAGDVTISEGNVVSATDTSSTTIEYGAALFETLSSTAVVKELNLKVNLKKGKDNITRNSLISGLTITNSGKIENVNLTSFSSDFVGLVSSTRRLMMIYSGIASINTGRDALITGCNIDTDMIFNDFDNAQLIFVGGIAFTNYATIDSCISGDELTQRSISVIGQNESDVIQVAGIVVTNASYSTLTNCQNYANISVAATNRNDNFVVYIAGVTDFASGTVQGNENHGTIIADNVLQNNLHKGDISANESY